MAGVRWDSAKVAALRRSLTELYDGSFMASANRLCGAAAVSLVDEGFQKSEDPFGHPWAPVKRNGMPLLKTGRLAKSFNAKSDSGGFIIESDVNYAAIHNYGGTVVHTARPNYHAANGRFLSERRLAKRKAYFSSMSRAHSVTIAQRMMVPDTKSLPASWKDAFQREVEGLLRRRFSGVR